MRATIVLVFVACSSRSSGPPPPSHDPPRAAVREERCGDARAIWRGEHREGADLYESLTLEVRGVTKPWTIDLLDFDSDARSPELFSPDCRHALFLRSRTGPYHIVRVDRLAEYSRGAAPDFVLAGEPDPNGITGTGVFRGGGWVSSTEVDYTWGCCDPPITTRFLLPERGSGAL